jgi:hypothetical protein
MIEFNPHPDIAANQSAFDATRHKTFYRHDYEQIFRDIALEQLPAVETYRQLILEDLFFVVLFVMGIEKANHPFVVQACHDLQDGPESNTLDVWAREHYKSAIITQAETLQYHLKHPDHCTGIFAYVRPVAKAFLRSIKVLCETSDLLKLCFPDILWDRPETQAPKWSEDDGLIFKRKGAARKESTIEAWGLIEGSPTSRHFDRRIYDDIETADIADSPDMLAKCFSRFEMSDNLGVDGGIERVIGTFYSHYGPVVKIRDKKDVTGAPMYHTRIKPATHNGQRDGKPVLLSQERLDKLKMASSFNSQQLCDPTPGESLKLDFHQLKPIDPEDVPRDVYKFLIIDQAGDDDTNITEGDSWSIGVVGVKPQLDDIGASDVFLLDIMAGPMSHAEAIENIVQVYCRNGMIMQLGVEKVGLSTTEIHICNALRSRGKKLSVENKNLVLLRPAGRSKVKRIESALQWPLLNGKLHYSTAIPQKYIDAVQEEMDKFPFYHVDILDMWAYAFDMIKEFRFERQGLQRDHSSTFAAISGVFNR